MAPFNTHWVIAEQLWPELPGPWQDYYGQFCFGCVVPDVDKISATLTQKDTHFFDRTTDYEWMATRRSMTFIQQRAKLLSQPFQTLPPSAQAFVLGYLCHLAVDEVSKHLWRRETYQKVQANIGAAFAALDELAWHKIKYYQQIVDRLTQITPLSIITFIPPHDLEAMYNLICQFAQAEQTEQKFRVLVEGFLVNSDTRAKWYSYFNRDIELARQQVDYFELDRLVALSLPHSHQRILALIAGDVPKPSYPF